MILESLVTTIDPSNGRVNVAPMGPLTNRLLQSFVLRPFSPSTTYTNLAATRRATIHVTDNVLMIARAVTGTWTAPPETRMLDDGQWSVLTDACRYFAVTVTAWEEDGPRARAECKMVHSGEQRPFFGLNRAKHAVIEAAILLTRTHLIDHDEIRRKMTELQPLVEKTAGDDERTAFEAITQALQQRLH